MSSNNNTNDYNQRGGRVLELYDQGKNTREIAKELRMSLSDIGFILKKGQVNHGIATITDNGNNKRDEITYLKNQIQALVGYIDRLKSEDQQQQKIGNERHS